MAEQKDIDFPGPDAALIGFTGYVGGNLHAQFDGYAGLFNSKNIGDIGKRKWKTVVCAGAPGFKIGANVLKQTMDGRPYNDTTGMDDLIEDLGAIECERFVLISTISAYAVTSHAESLQLRPEAEPLSSVHALDESRDVWSRQLAKGGLSDSEYGRNRARLESWVRETFPSRHLIVRLPGIFGLGMKKNFIYDLITESPWRHKIDLNTYHQWYALRHLTGDIRRILQYNDDVERGGAITAEGVSAMVGAAKVAGSAKGFGFKDDEADEKADEMQAAASAAVVDAFLAQKLEIVNLFPEALKTQEIVERFFPAQASICKTSDGAGFVDEVRTMHAHLWPEADRGPTVDMPGMQGKGGYRFMASVVLKELQMFLADGGNADKVRAAAAERAKAAEAAAVKSA